MWHDTCFIALARRARWGALLHYDQSEDTPMLYWTIVFLIIALVAGVLGFSGIYVAAAGIAKILFFVFIVLFLISLISGGFNRRTLP
jgi:uncharacterized membrane protein YtjA (UPF0391 family)